MCFNNLDGLRSTYNSIWSQKCRDFEWIVIDGASTDGTKTYLEKLNNENTTWISEPDNGIYDAMNKGLDIAKGEYMIFLNSGDTFSDSDVLDKIKKSITITESKPILLYGDAYEIDKDGVLFFKKARSHKMIDFGMFTHHQAMIYRSDSIKKFKYPLEYKIGSDYALTAKLVEENNSAVYLNFAICVFEQGGASHLSQKLGKAEQNEIRKTILRTPFYKRIMISILQSFSAYLRNGLPIIYKLLRYKKSKLS